MKIAIIGVGGVGGYFGGNPMLEIWNLRFNGSLAFLNTGF